jgi:hypothetical protein
MIKCCVACPNGQPSREAGESSRKVEQGKRQPCVERPTKEGTARTPAEGSNAKSTTAHKRWRMEGRCPSDGEVEQSAGSLLETQTARASLTSCVAEEGGGRMEDKKTKRKGLR